MLCDPRLRAVGEHVPQLRQLGVAVFLNEPGDVVTASSAAGLALDREGRDAKVREGVGVVSHGSGFALGRLLHRLAPNCARPRLPMLSLGGGYRPNAGRCEKSQDARQTDKSQPRPGCSDLRLGQLRGRWFGRHPHPAQLGSVRRCAARLYTELTLQVRGQTVHETRPDDRMLLQLRSQSLQEGAALERMDRRCGRLNGVVFGVTKAERHGVGAAPGVGAPRWRCAGRNFKRPTTSFYEACGSLRNWRANSAGGLT